MTCAARIRVRTSYTCANGTSQGRLLVIISSQPKWLPLNLHWLAQSFDQTTGTALPRRRGDKDAADSNLQAGQELARATSIFAEWHLRGQDLTMADFLKDFHFMRSCGNPND